MTKFITNQNIEIQLELASLGDRILAFLIDAFFIGMYSFAMLFILSSLKSTIEWLFGIVFVPVMFYTLFFETFYNGQTPGKKSMEIKVVKIDGGSPSFINYLLRWILRPIDILLYGSVAILSIIVTRNGQRLGDLAAGTTVIKMRTEVKIDDIKAKPLSDYSVTFPQVKRLNDKQIELIRTTLQMRRDGHNAEAADQLALKVKAALKVESDMPPVKFLYTIISDYEHIYFQT